MKIQRAHVSYDGTITFRNEKGVDVAYAGDASFAFQVVSELEWKAFGSPTQPEGYFLILTQGYNPDEFDIDAGEVDWVPMTLDVLDDFCP